MLVNIKYILVISDIKFRKLINLIIERQSVCAYFFY